MRGMIVNFPDASQLGLRSTLDPGIKVEIENGELCIRLDSTMRRGDSVLGYHLNIDIFQEKAKMAAKSSGD